LPVVPGISHRLLEVPLQIRLSQRGTARYSCVCAHAAFLLVVRRVGAQAIDPNVRGVKPLVQPYKRGSDSRGASRYRGDFQMRRSPRELGPVVVAKGASSNANAGRSRLIAASSEASEPMPKDHDSADNQYTLWFVALPADLELPSQIERLEDVFRNKTRCVMLPDPRADRAALARTTCKQRRTAAFIQPCAEKKQVPCARPGRDAVLVSGEEVRLRQETPRTFRLGRCNNEIPTQS